MKQMKTHWVADMYPLNETDIEPLAASIKANGQRTPIMALKDGTIIDGRNRWLACQKAGVEPIITIINPDGEDVSEETLWSIATDCNSMRRDMTSSLRACLAALSWGKFKELNGIKHGGDRKTKNQVPRTVGLDLSDFRKFAQEHFKSPIHQSEQALAILNHSPELLEDAKEGLAEAYKTYQTRVAEDRVKRQNMKMLEDPASSDIRERVANNNLAMEEAITLLRKRNEEEIRRIEAEAASRLIGRKQLQSIAWFYSHFCDSEVETIVNLFTPEKGEDPIFSSSKEQPLDKKSLLKVAELLTNTANAINN